MNTSSLFISRSKSMSHCKEGCTEIQAPLTNSHRYIFNPCIDGYIDDTATTLNLAICCIWYLCQRHHDAWISDDQIAKNIISGDYRLHNYAVTMWLDLVERYVSLNGSKPLHSDLIRALEYLATNRYNSEFVASIEFFDQSQRPNLEKFKDKWPKLHTLLMNMVQFYWRCSSSEYHLNKGERCRKPANYVPLNLHRIYMDTL